MIDGYPIYYDRGGNPIDFVEWGELFHNKDYQRLAHETLPDGTFITTVWLGLDHGVGLGRICWPTIGGNAA